MMKINALLGLVALLAFMGSASACFMDTQCNSTSFCNESAGSGTCVAIDTTPDGACGVASIACVNAAQCAGLGKEQCYRGACKADSSLGEPCQLDQDCGSGNVCILSVCTDQDVITQVACSSDTDCGSYAIPTGSSCVAGTCRGKGKVGAYCNSHGDCAAVSGLCGDNVCVECPYDSWDVTYGYENVSNLFCNQNHEDTCDDLNFYPTYALANSLYTPIIEEKKSDGDSCDNNKCCYSNVCTAGHCVGNLPSSIPQQSNMSQSFCNDTDLGYSLSTHWFDGKTAATDAPNSTFFASWFGYTDATFFTVNCNNLRGAMQPVGAVAGNYIGERRLDGADYGMSAFFYDNTTGDICYFMQDGTKVVSHCIESCIAAGRAKVWTTGAANKQDTDVAGHRTAHIGASTSEQDTDVVCKDSTMGIIIYDSDVGAFDGGIIGIAITGGMDGNSVEYYSTSLGQAGILNRLSSYDGSGSHTNNLPVGAGTPWLYFSPTIQTWNMGWANQYVQAKANGVGSQLTPTIAEGDYSGDIVCCEENADCELIYGSGSCCDLDSKSCVACNTGTNFLDFVIYSSDPKFETGVFCANATTTFSISLKDFVTQAPIHPDGVITVSAPSGGTVNPTSCNADDTPCTFMFTTKATTGYDDIFVDYSSGSEYGEWGVGIEVYVSATCHFVELKVFDLTQQIATGKKLWLSGVKVDSSTGETYYTASDGHAIFGDLGLATINFTLTKEGYKTTAWSFTTADLDKTREIGMVQDTTATNGNGLADMGLNTTAPTTPAEVTSGFLKIVYAFITWPFTWIILFITFLIGIGVLKLMAGAATG